MVVPISNLPFESKVMRNESAVLNFIFALSCILSCASSPPVIPTINPSAAAVPVVVLVNTIFAAPLSDALICNFCLAVPVPKIN